MRSRRGDAPTTGSDPAVRDRRRLRPLHCCAFRARFLLDLSRQRRPLIRDKSNQSINLQPHILPLHGRDNRGCLPFSLHSNLPIFWHRGVPEMLLIWGILIENNSFSVYRIALCRPILCIPTPRFTELH